MDDNSCRLRFLRGCDFGWDGDLGLDKSLVADLRVKGSGTTRGTLHIEGAWQATVPLVKFRILGRRSIRRRLRLQSVMTSRVWVGGRA